MIAGVAIIDPGAAFIIAVEQNGGQIVMHRLHLQAKGFYRPQGDLDRNFLPVEMNRQQGIDQPIIIKLLRVGYSQQQMQATLCYPSGHLAQGTRGQHPVDDQHRNRLPVRYPSLIWPTWTELVDDLDQPDLSQILQQQPQPAHLVSLFDHPFSLEGDELLHLGGQRLAQGLDLFDGGQRYLWLGQRAVLPGLHPVDQSTRRVDHRALPAACLPECDRRFLRPDTPLKPHPGQTSFKLAQVAPKTIGTQHPAGVQFLQWYRSPQGAVGMVEVDHASYCLRIAHVDDDALPALQIEDDAVLENQHLGQGRSI